MTLLSQETKFTAANKSGRLLFFSIGMGALVDIDYDAQAAQADRALRCLSLFRASRRSVVVFVPTRNTLLIANPPPITSFPMPAFGWNSVGCTDYTAILNSFKDKLQKELSIQQLPTHPIQ